MYILLLYLWAWAVVMCRFSMLLTKCGPSTYATIYGNPSHIQTTKLLGNGFSPLNNPCDLFVRLRLRWVVWQNVELLLNIISFFSCTMLRTFFLCKNGESIVNGSKKSGWMEQVDNSVSIALYTKDRTNLKRGKQIERDTKKVRKGKNRKGL